MSEEQYRHKVLGQRKAHFSKNLQNSLEILGYVTIIHLFLLDHSLTALLLRTIANSVTANPFPREVKEIFESQSGKGMMFRLLLLLPVTVFVAISSVRLVFGPSVPLEFDGYQHAPYVLQIIGDRGVSGMRICANEVFVVCLQMLMLAVWQEAEEAQETQVAQDVDDGYSGQIVAAHVNVRKLFDVFWAGLENRGGSEVGSEGEGNSSEGEGESGRSGREIVGV